MNVKTYKFLQTGGRSPLSRFDWPLPTATAPGAWVEVEGELRLCRNGLHVCQAADLPYWLHDELWEVETEGDFIEGLDCRVVRRARLIRKIGAWNDGGATRFVNACVAHAAARAGSTPDTTVQAMLDDATVCANAGYFAVGAYCAATAASRSSPQEAGIEQAFREERVWQGAWISSELLADPP
jgi:hypothetical protein